jgi:hypothetical protein
MTVSGCPASTSWDLVSKQFALKQAGGNCSTVQLYEDSIFSGAQSVYCPARSALCLCLSHLRSASLRNRCSPSPEYPRFAYVAGLRLSAGEPYAHWGLTRVYGEEAAQQAIADAHGKLFLHLLRTPLRNLRHDLKISRRYVERHSCRIY